MNTKSIRTILSGILLAAASITASAADTPSYPGGQNALNTFIAGNLRYPAAAVENMVEGVVTVSFTVNPDGTISNARIVRPIDPDLEKEALRIVAAMPAWTPADKEGTPVAAQATVRIRFTLPS